MWWHRWPDWQGGRRGSEEVWIVLWFKRCPRCSGDLYEERDMYGRYVACFQCGHYLSEAEEVALKFSSGYQPVGQLREAA